MTVGWLLAIVYGVGALGFLFDQTRHLMVRLVWVNLMITLFVVLAFHRKWTREFVLSALMVAACGFLIEVLGVNTGFIFGSYQYGPTLGYELWNTPLMMAVNWLTSIYITRQVAEMISSDIGLTSAIAAALMVVLDYFIEPFAIKNGLWAWSSMDVPLQNYVAWFVISFVLHYLFIRAIKFPTNKLSLPVYVIQLTFFIALFILNR